MKNKKINFVNYRVKGWDALHDKMHVHDNSYEILQVISGTGNFIIGGVLYPMTPGTVFFTNAMYLHCSRIDNESQYIRSKMTVNAAYFDEILRALELTNIAEALFGTDGGCCVSLSAELAKEVDTEFRKMAEYFETAKTDTDAKIALSLVRILLICADAHPLRHSEYSNGNEFISRAINYINENISCDLTVETIAKDIFVSKYYLCRIFKRTFGVSIMKYILSQRITLAKKQLIDTDISCSNIATMLGFSSFSYFCRVFKQQEGVTPNKYRKLYKDIAKRQRE